MNLELVLTFLCWNMIIHIAILAYWVVMMIFFRDKVYTIHSKWFLIAETDFNKTHYLLMGYYKLTIIVFVVVPYFVLKFLV